MPREADGPFSAAVSGLDSAGPTAGASYISSPSVSTNVRPKSEGLTAFSLFYRYVLRLLPPAARTDTNPKRKRGTQPTASLALRVGVTSPKTDKLGRERYSDLVGSDKSVTTAAED